MTLPEYRFDVFARRPDLSLAGVVDYQALELHPIYSAAGTWILDLTWDGDWESPAGVLLTPGAGIVVDVNGRTITSGPVTKPVLTRDDAGRKVQIAGADDLLVLADRVAHPEPTSSVPPYNAQAYDLRTGPAETVIKGFVDANAGPGAIAERAILGLTVELDRGRGGAVKDQGRWQPLTDLISALALRGRVGYRVVQSGDGREFQVYEPANKSATVVFAIDLGNQSEYTYSAQRPAGNYVFGLGAGTGTARTVREATDAASVVDWGRIETTIDRGDTSDATVLDGALADELDGKATQLAVTTNTVDTLAHQWAAVATSSSVETYDLGDLVTIDVEGVDVTETIRELAITHSPDAGTSITPILGTPDHGDPLELLFRTLIRRQRALEANVRNLQRR